jgi:hypothetical protein
MRLKSNEMDKQGGLELPEQIWTVLTEVRGLQERWHNQVEAKQSSRAGRGRGTAASPACVAAREVTNRLVT